MRQLMFFLGAVLLCWTVAVGADKSAAPVAPPVAPKAASKPPKVLYDLAFRPSVGMRYAYELSDDSEVNFHAAANVTRRSGDVTSKSHTQIVVTSEEITQIGIDGQVVARRITFGPNCFSETKEHNQPARKLRLVYAGKTVNARVNADDTIEQDYGVKPKPEDTRRLRNAIRGNGALFAGKPVAIGERWRADDGLRALANLRENDIVSSIVTLKAVRDAEGGERVADLAVTAGVITSKNGVHAEISYEGTVSVDVKTGQVLSGDLVGQVNVAGGVGTLTSGKAAALSLTATGRSEIHTRGRMLPPATPATQPANIAVSNPRPQSDTPAQRTTVRLLED